MTDFGFVQNAAGRRVPTMVNGKAQAPYQGVGVFQPKGAKAGPPIRSSQNYPADGDKRVPDLRTALQQCGLKDGMTISSHHHLRNGDRVALEALRIASDMGVRDLMWFPSASFPCHEPVIDLMEDQADVEDLGGTMRLGIYPAKLTPGTLTEELYGEPVIYERHRHRWEVNNRYRSDLEAAGLVFSGVSPDDRLVEIIELPSHPYFIASQFHPEFKSRPDNPHPLFLGFVAAALEHRKAQATSEPSVSESSVVSKR